MNYVVENIPLSFGGVGNHQPSHVEVSLESRNGREALWQGVSNASAGQAFRVPQKAAGKKQ